MYYAVVFGHSFVSRAKSFVNIGLEDTDRNLNLMDFDIKWMGFGGAKVDTLDWKCYKLCRVQPDAVVLDIGSNDLVNRSCSPDELASRVYDLAISILGTVESVQKVIVLDICCRSPTSRYPARRDFNECAQTYNEAIRDLCHDGDGRVCVAPLKGLGDYQQYLSEDGVHLSQTTATTQHSGTFHYAMAIRRALVKASRSLSPRH